MQRARRLLGLGLAAALAFAVPFCTFWVVDRVREPERAAGPPEPLVIAVPRLPEAAPRVDEPLTTPPEPRSEPAPEVLARVRETLLSSYYLPVSPIVLAEPSVEAMVRALGDPYTEYLTPAELQRMRRETLGGYGGLGLLVVRTDRGLLVDSVPGATHEGVLRPGDVIVKIDDHWVAGMEIERAVSLIGGEPGTLVELLVHRGGVPIAVPVVRRALETPGAVRVHSLAAHRHRIAHVRITSFATGTTPRLRAALDTVLDADVKGILVDLRHNPGGLVEEAVGVASLFLQSGPIGITGGYNRGPNRLFANGESVDSDIPVVVLVDSHTASAAEMVAAALADNRRAVVVGERTYGKGAVQAVRPLPDGGALRFTSSLYVTPTGRPLAGLGIEPAIVAPDDLATPLDETLAAGKRALAGLLERPTGLRVLPF